MLDFEEEKARSILKGTETYGVITAERRGVNTDSKIILLYIILARKSIYVL